MRTRHILTAAAALAFAFPLVGPSLAADINDNAKSPAAKEAAPAQTKGSGKETRGNKGEAKEDKEQNVRMEEVEIHGQLENPDVFYIIPRRKAEMDTGSLSMDYTKDIMEPLMPEPFEARHGQNAK